MPLITLFTAPKPFVNPQIAMIQRNAIRSWIALGDDVEVLLLGEETGLEEAARELNVKWIRDLERNADGTPLISTMFGQAQRHGTGELMAIINTDILLMQNFVDIARKVKQHGGQFLMLGHRWDLDVKESMPFAGDWQADLRTLIHREGRLHKSKGSDYFIFPRAAFPVFPKFAIGRAGWDNWTIYHARKQGWQVIDATAAITVVHQQHDYHHLPGGKIHYTLPESDENLRIAGGKRHIFTLADANFKLDANGNIRRMTLNPGKMKREIEIFPIMKWDKPFLNDLGFYLMNPRKLIRHKFPRLAKALGIKGKADDIQD
ncbi:MAG: hypothetical protein C0391_02385 [Anaerolinea sp.]|nr:hypothetical protein [Anaerolinea sp.]